MMHMEEQFGMVKKNYPIDFVMLWVDDSDPEWREERNRNAPRNGFLIDDSEARYRDWNTLKYWFRGVEKFAPWVHNIFFVTCGHLPSWLNTEAKNLFHIKHRDYIPPEFLPTFSSHPIELCLNRIHELSVCNAAEWDKIALNRKMVLNLI